LPLQIHLLHSSGSTATSTAAATTRTSAATSEFALGRKLYEHEHKLVMVSLGRQAGRHEDVPIWRARARDTPIVRFRRNAGSSSRSDPLPPPPPPPLTAAVTAAAAAAGK
jgi:hypothetical protein